MSQARLLWLVSTYPHPTALARHVRDGSVFAALRRLEAGGFVTRRRGGYRLTNRGRHELAMARLVTRLLTQAQVRSGRRARRDR